MPINVTAVYGIRDVQIKCQYPSTMWIFLWNAINIHRTRIFLQNSDISPESGSFHEILIYSRSLDLSTKSGWFYNNIHRHTELGNLTQNLVKLHKHQNNTHKLFSNVSIPNKVRYTSVPNIHKWKPSPDKIRIQQPKI